MNQTFNIHVGITQCAGVSKREPQLMYYDSNTFMRINMKAFGADQITHVVITKHIQVDQTHYTEVSKWKSQHFHCDSISNAIIQLNIHMAPCGDPSHHTYQGQRCTETIHGMGAVNCDLSMKAFGADQCTQAHCADVSKWKSQHIHCDSISNGIIQLNPHMAPRGEPSHHTDPRQRNGYAHMTSLDGYTKLIRSCDIDTRTIVRTLHLCPQSLGNDIQSPKSLDMSIKVLSHSLSPLLGNYI